MITKSGAWFTYGELQLGQGKENVRKFLKDNPELADEIENKILIAMGIREDPNASAGDTAGDDATESAADETGEAKIAVVMDETENESASTAKKMRKAS